MNEARNFIENTLLEYKGKYGLIYNRFLKTNRVTNFLDKLTNEIKIIPIESYIIIGKAHKIMQSSNGICKFIRIFHLKSLIEGKISENLTDFYLRCENIPILWKKFFVRIANERANRIKSCSEQYCESHFLLYKWKQ